MNNKHNDNNNLYTDFKESVSQEAIKESLFISGHKLDKMIIKGLEKGELNQSQALTAFQFPRAVRGLGFGLDKVFKIGTAIDIFQDYKKESFGRATLNSIPKLFGPSGEILHIWWNGMTTGGRGKRQFSYWPDYNLDDINAAIPTNNSRVNISTSKYNASPRQTSSPHSGTSNSASYGNSVSQDTNPRVIQATISKTKKPSFIGTLLRFLGSAANKYTAASPSPRHSGGKIPGHGEVMAILQGGETVRTEGQEAALQEEISKQRIASIEKRNFQSDEIQNKRLIGEMLYTKDMKNFIINTIIEAYNYNQCGFRRLIG